MHLTGGQASRCSQVAGAPASSQEQQVLDALSHIQDPDLGKDIVACGFVKQLIISGDGAVSFTLQLTTPACPIKEEFRSQVCLSCTCALKLFSELRLVPVAGTW